MKGRLQSARDILQMKQEGFFKVRSMFEILLKERSDELQVNLYLITNSKFDSIAISSIKM